MAYWCMLMKDERADVVYTTEKHLSYAVDKMNIFHANYKVFKLHSSPRLTIASQGFFFAFLYQSL